MSIPCVRTVIKVWRHSELWHITHTYIWSRPLLILHPSVCQVLCYPGSTWIFSASRDKTVLMWDLNQGDEPIQEFCGHELVVNGLAVSPGTYVYTHKLLNSSYLLVFIHFFKKPFVYIMSVWLKARLYHIHTIIFLQVASYWSKPNRRLIPKHFSVALNIQSDTGHRVNS